MNEILEGVTSATDYIQKAPLAPLIILFLNALGYALKRAPFLPNRSIPLMLMLVGALLMMFLAPMPEGRNPLLLLGIMGFLFGCIAWLVHAIALRRLEKYLPGALDPEDENKPKPPQP